MRLQVAAAVATLLFCQPALALESGLASMDTPLIVLLIVAAGIAGFVDTIAGGGGLITLPVLFLTGLSPLQVLATNKFQSCFGSGSATIIMLKKGKLNLTQIWPAFVIALLMSAVGALAVQQFNSQHLSIAIPFVVGIIALYFLLCPTAGDVEVKPRVSAWAYRIFIVPIISFYDGFFGPGTGSFFSMAEVALRGRALVAATANAKALNFATNIASLIIFAFGGHVVWAVGAVMISGQLLGAFFGSKVIISGGAKWIRPVIVLVCFALLFKHFFV